MKPEFLVCGGGTPINVEVAEPVSLLNYELLAAVARQVRADGGMVFEVIDPGVKEGWWPRR